MIRIYRSDRGLDVTGGVGLPQLTLVAANGSRQPVQDCAAAGVPDAGLTQAVAAAGAGVPFPVRSDTRYFDPPRWTKHYNIATSTGSQTEGPTLGDLVFGPVSQLTTQLPSGGAAENVHNKYVFTGMTQEYGQVLELGAKAPLTPRTYEGEPVMQGGEMRYWSMCTNEQTTMYLACLNDDQVPVDPEDRYRIVISTKEARPANARPQCGIAWLPAGPLPESVLILRNMLPDPGFPHSIQNAEVDTEEATMGPYYPGGRYYRTKADFEKLGCPQPSGSCAAALTPASKFKRKSLRASTERIKVRGRALAACRGANVAKVLIGIGRRTGDGGCRFLNRSGSLSKPRSCKRPRYLDAKGTSKWRFRSRRDFAPGRYVAFVMAVDANGNAEKTDRKRNRLRFRIR